MKPNRKHYTCDDGLHAAMRVWAAKQGKPAAVATVTFSDGSVFADTFPRQQVEVKYLANDGKAYTVMVDSSLYAEPWFSSKGPMCLRSLKAEYPKHIANRVASGKFKINWSK